MVALIRSSATPLEAKERLMTTFELSEVQAQAILDMRLQRLTGLERGKLEEELRDLTAKIAWYQSILGDSDVLWGVIRDEVQYIKDTYSSPDGRKSSGKPSPASISKICFPTTTW